MVKLAKPFSRLGSGKALVIGDLILDTYTLGNVTRISPEAPVPVLHVSEEKSRPGGAGNVALSLVALGMEVIAVGRVGGDLAGRELKEQLVNYKVNTGGIVEEEGYQTPLKKRVIAGTQQIVRVDYEKITPLTQSFEQLLIEHIPNLLEDVKVVAISDYGKGFLTPVLLKAFIEAARERSIPVIVDPKGTSFAKYMGVTVLKPNLAEARIAARLGSQASLEEVAAKIFEDSAAEILLITKSENGISVFHRDSGYHSDFPVKVKEVNDVTGAGDTVLAMLACAFASDLSISDAAQLANIAAGVAIEHMGCVHVTKTQIAQRLLEYDVVNKVYEEDHLHAVQEILQDRRYRVLGLKCNEGLTPLIFESICKLSRSSEFELILYVCDKQLDEKFVSMLASMREVSLIIIKGESLRRLCDRITPEEVFLIENGEMVQIEHMDALLQN
ncbi:MAG: rfaE bifunctional protein kinase chain/domain [Chlamydiales bacterium]|jgi:rfaE bifunctional protein kinase chain/domain